jgi:DNA-binding MarR family transcriptional regulator
VEVALTDKGRDILRNLDPHVNRMPRAVLGHLGAAKLKQLKRLLEHVIAGLGTFP